MDIFISIIVIIGTISFAMSGAMTGLGKHMDVFGVCILGLTTSTGGGIIRDLLLGLTPPAIFHNPQNILISIVVSVMIFVPAVRNRLTANRKIFDFVMIVTDAAGLGIFTVYGVKVAMDAGFSDNFWLVVCVSVITGVGGGVVRDIFAGDRPYIFVKHIYAVASIAGSAVCIVLWEYIGQNASILAGFTTIFVLRLCAAKFRWSLPKA